MNISTREVKRAVKFHRVRIAEGLGSQRFSRPAIHDLDRLLEPFLPAGPGFFVEVGANDGYTQSNTYFLERHRGWRGLLIEPVPHLAAAARRIRPGSVVIEAALTAPDFDGSSVTLEYADLMSVVWTGKMSARDEQWVKEGARLQRVRRRQMQVPARTMTSVVREHAPERRIDLMVIDVEGHEADVLRGTDVGDLDIDLLLVESNFAEDVRALLLDRYEEPIQVSPRDLLFRRRRPFP